MLSECDNVNHSHIFSNLGIYFRRSDRYEEILLDHVAHPQHDVPHETSYQVPHEIHESVKLTNDWLNLIEHEEGAMHIEDELRKNQMLHGELLFGKLRFTINFKGNSIFCLYRLHYLLSQEPMIFLNYCPLSGGQVCVTGEFET